MADNYKGSSSFLDVPLDKIDLVQGIIDKASKKLEAEDGFVHIDYNIEKNTEGRTGVWFYSERYANPEHVEHLAKAIIETLKLTKPFYCSWAYTCSKPRIDEFGGGAFCVRLGKKTIWVNAMNEVINRSLTIYEYSIKTKF